MRQFVQTFTQNKLKDTLPQALAALRLPQRRVLPDDAATSSPTTASTPRSGSRKSSIMQARKAPRPPRSATASTIGNALAEMERHFKSSRKPLFTFIQTMSAHWPYDFKYEPEVDVSRRRSGTEPGDGRISAPRLHGQDGLRFPDGSSCTAFPHERFLVVHYGDHHPDGHPHAARLRRPTRRPRTWLLDPGSIGFVTYYAVRGINYRVPALPQFETLDVALSRHRHPGPGRACRCPISIASASG